jgi:hypothetical protein
VSREWYRTLKHEEVALNSTLEIGSGTAGSSLAPIDRERSMA